ncbi:hypothetical protein B0T18DRAFT_447392 [Schizothecium vesticola]|uniref:GIY-YIG domain-containing protein n=1 Tax=Schizothecium vesticola TaxID=314040 RepID=A0AA40EWU3_9PEZI|nr:hypothetical protein B0T18DRAFT_447392 [Schizothecium vesticola]
MSTGTPRFTFSKDSVTEWKDVNEKHCNWPVVYVLDDGRAQPTPARPRDIYVGESLNLVSRLRQHLETPAKQHLKHFRPIIRDMFNKSVCLDLESYLIKMMAGDGANRVLHRNNGITETNYYQCEMYRDSFPLIFEQLRREGLFTRTIPEIENSDLYKLSPFKALTEDQADSIEEIARARPSPTHAPPLGRDFGDYDFRLFDDVTRMRAEIFRRDAEVGLARMAAGFAWEWRSWGRANRGLYDIEIGAARMRWNSRPADWITSSGALEEVGSVHTVQGYDLNYLFVDRASYFDKKGKENNPKLGKTYTVEDLLRLITQIYKVLLTRGIRGTYVYACDEPLREYLGRFIPRSHDWGAMVVD